MNKEFDSKRIYNKKFLKTKRKSCGNDATNFHDNEIPKVGSNYSCLAVILIDYLQVFLKE